MPVRYIMLLFRVFSKIKKFYISVLVVIDQFPFTGADFRP